MEVDFGMRFSNLLNVKALHIAILVAVAGTGSVSASNFQTEAVAYIESEAGIVNSYNIGLSFADEKECQKQIKGLNIVVSNLKMQGLAGFGKLQKLDCINARIIN